LVAGNMRVPCPAAGITAVRIDDALDTGSA